MVIVEVNRGLPDFTAVLGAHKWNQFLKQPSEDEVPRESRIFYCQLSDGRKVQKNGECLTVNKTRECQHGTSIYFPHLYRLETCSDW